MQRIITFSSHFAQHLHMNSCAGMKTIEFFLLGTEILEKDQHSMIVYL